MAVNTAVRVRAQQLYTYIHTGIYVCNECIYTHTQVGARARAIIVYERTTRAYYVGQGWCIQQARFDSSSSLYVCI